MYKNTCNPDQTTGIFYIKSRHCNFLYDKIYIMYINYIYVLFNLTYIALYSSAIFLNLLYCTIYQAINKLMLPCFIHLFFNPLFKIAIWIKLLICQFQISISNLCFWMVCSKYRYTIFVCLIKIN